MTRRTPTKATGNCNHEHVYVGSIESLTRRTGNCNHEHVYVEHCFDQKATGPLPLLFLQHKIFGECSTRRPQAARDQEHDQEHVLVEPSLEEEHTGEAELHLHHP